MAGPGTDFPGLGVGIVILRNGKFLLHRRLRAPEAGFWNIVGGKVDFMEPTADAARREAEEETGMRIGSLQFLGLTEQMLQQDRQHWVSVLYLACDVVGDPSLTEPDKLAEFGWFSRSELPSPLSAFAQAAIPLINETMFP